MFDILRRIIYSYILQKYKTDFISNLVGIYYILATRSIIMNCQYIKVKYKKIAITQDSSCIILL